MVRHTTAAAQQQNRREHKDNGRDYETDRPQTAKAELQEERNAHDSGAATQLAPILRSFPIWRCRAVWIVPTTYKVIVGGYSRAKERQAKKCSERRPPDAHVSEEIQQASYNQCC